MSFQSSLVRQSVATASKADPPYSAARPKFKRSRNGCITCRIGKTKCDETRPICVRCISMHKECQWAPVPQTKASSSTTGNKKQANQQQPQPLKDITKEDFEMLYPGLEEAMLAEASADFAFDIATPPELLFDPDTLQLLTGSSTSPEWKSSSSGKTTISLPLLPQPVIPTKPAPPSDKVFSNMSKSALVQRRSDKGKGREETVPPSTAVVVNGHNGISVGNVQTALMLDSLLFEFCPTGWNGSDPTGPTGSTSSSAGVGVANPSEVLKIYSAAGLKPSVTTSTNGWIPISIPQSIDHLASAFPSALGRQLFHHYITETSKILITMGNSGPNPFLSLSEPLVLLDNNSPSSAALRMAILSTSVTHLKHITEDKTSIAPLIRWAVSTDDHPMSVLGNKFKKASLANLTMSMGSDNGSLSGEQGSDVVLATVVTIMTRDVLEADPSWQENLDFGVALIHKRGGPGEMLNDKASTFNRRFLIEQIATHDVFGTFTTGREPALLGGWNPWWFESVESAKTGWEWESVERSFGISRAMIDLIARISILYSRKNRLGISLTQKVGEMSAVAQHIIDGATCLLQELDIWGNSLRCLPQHVRVNCGDHIYRYTMTLHVLADLLEYPKDHPRVAASVGYVLELCSEAACMNMSVMLMWPLLISGAFCAAEHRPWILSLFEAFQPQYCQDLKVARTLMLERWKSMDQGEGVVSWPDLMRRIGKSVLLI